MCHSLRKIPDKIGIEVSDHLSHLQELAVLTPWQVGWTYKFVSSLQSSEISALNWQAVFTYVKGLELKQDEDIITSVKEHHKIWVKWDIFSKEAAQIYFINGTTKI
jgi:hypothetical protein